MVHLNKRFLSAFFVFLFILSSFGQAFAGSNYEIISTKNNTIQISSTAFGSDMRIMVQKDTEDYYYSLNNNIEYLPVQLGNGTYKVSILKNVEGNKYKVLSSKTINVLDNDEFHVYLSSSQPVYWENNTTVIDLGNELTKGLETNREKIQAVYKYIVENIKYDYNKINYISNDYVPNISNTLLAKSGICYDYSSLFAALLRSQGIHTKLVKGYKVGTNTYHAWNEILIDGHWQLIDTTFDAGNYNADNMIKNMNEYTKVREY